jgi:hypothetical protein
MKSDKKDDCKAEIEGSPLLLARLSIGCGKVCCAMAICLPILFAILWSDRLKSFKEPSKKRVAENEYT